MNKSEMHKDSLSNEMKTYALQCLEKFLLALLCRFTCERFPFCVLYGGFNYQKTMKGEKTNDIDVFVASAKEDFSDSSLHKMKYHLKKQMLAGWYDAGVSDMRRKALNLTQVPITTTSQPPIPNQTTNSQPHYNQSTTNFQPIITYNHPITPYNTL